MLASNSFAEKIVKMGCEWNVPERFIKNSESLWKSNSNGEQLLSYLYFEDDFFNKDHVEISFEETNLERKIFSSLIDNGYEIVIYNDYLKNNNKVSFAAMGVIRKQSGKGVFYLNNLGAEEIISMTENCMPGINRLRFH